MNVDKTGLGRDTSPPSQEMVPRPGAGPQLLGLYPALDTMVVQA